jgi:hypothetical protein
MRLAVRFSTSAEGHLRVKIHSFQKKRKQQFQFFAAFSVCKKRPPAKRLNPISRLCKSPARGGSWSRRVVRIALFTA